MWLITKYDRYLSTLTIMKQHVIETKPYSYIYIKSKLGFMIMGPPV